MGFIPVDSFLLCTSIKLCFDLLSKNVWSNLILDTLYTCIYGNMPTEYTLVPLELGWRLYVVRRNEHLFALEALPICAIILNSTETSQNPYCPTPIVSLTSWYISCSKNFSRVVRNEYVMHCIYRFHFSEISTNRLNVYLITEPATINRVSMINVNG